MRLFSLAVVALIGLALPALADGPKLSGVQPAVTLFTPPTVCTGPNCQGQTGCPGCVNCPSGYCTSGECGLAGCGSCSSCYGSGRPVAYSVRCRAFHPFGGRFRR